MYDAVFILCAGMTQVVHKFEDIMRVYSRVSTYIRRVWFAITRASPLQLYLCVCTGSPDTCEHSTRWRRRPSPAANSATVLATTVTVAGTEGGKLHLLNKSTICMYD